MKALLGIIHLLVSIALIAVVLMQHRKAGGFTGAFSGGGTYADMANSSWSRMSALVKLTVVLVALFMIVSLLQVIA